MTSVTGAIALLSVLACGVSPEAGRVVRLSATGSDTIIVNSRRPAPLPIRALDAAGHVVAAPIRYEWTDGDSLPVDALGRVTCTRPGDLGVRAAFESLTIRVIVRCRPVEYVRFPGPIQFILGDTEMERPRVFPVSAFGANGRPVAILAGSVDVLDTSVAMLHGLRLYPVSRGITIADASFGDRSASIGIHIYQRVDTLAALDTLLRVDRKQRLFAVPLRLESGEFTRQRLPPGGWMLTMLPEENKDPNPIRLRVEGAACEANIFNTPRRFVCSAGPSASVIIYRPFRKSQTSVERGYLLVRWLFT
jgi:hypothetical protein